MGFIWHIQWFENSALHSFHLKSFKEIVEFILTRALGQGNPRIVEKEGLAHLLICSETSLDTTKYKKNTIKLVFHSIRPCLSVSVSHFSHGSFPSFSFFSKEVPKVLCSTYNYISVHIFRLVFTFRHELISGQNSQMFLERSTLLVVEVVMVILHKYRI